jgi:hypothetical protein
VSVSLTPHSMRIIDLVDSGPAFEAVQWSAIIGVSPDIALREVLDAGGLAIARRDLPRRPIAARRELEAAAQRIRHDVDLLVRASAACPDATGEPGDDAR